MPHLLLRPSLHLARPLLTPPGLRSMTWGLTNLDRAAAGDLLGFALGHGVGPRYIGGAVSEYDCAFTATGDGRSCDGTVFRLAPQAQSVLDRLLPPDLEAGALARLFHWGFGAPEHEFETVHFADFTVAFLYDGPEDVREIRIFAEPARDARDAERRAAEFSALFAFLGEWHTTLSRYRYDLPTPDMLRRAA